MEFDEFVRVETPCLLGLSYALAGWDPSGPSVELAATTGMPVMVGPEDAAIAAVGRAGG